jgi:hypothetical protein
LKRGQNIKYLPYAFTEHGALQAANVLRSKRAVQMSVFVIRAFVKMREALRGTPELARKLTRLEKKLTDRLNIHEAAIVEVLQEVMQILNPPPNRNRRNAESVFINPNNFSFFLFPSVPSYFPAFLINLK